jgi:hypothetical protein
MIDQENIFAQRFVCEEEFFWENASIQFYVLRWGVLLDVFIFVVVIYVIFIELVSIFFFLSNCLCSVEVNMYVHFR